MNPRLSLFLNVVMICYDNNIDYLSYLSIIFKMICYLIL